MLLMLTVAGCGTDSTPTPTSGSATATPTITPTLAPGQTPTHAPPAATATSAPTFDAAAHFRGKTIRIAVNSPPGGSTDVAARYVASQLSKFVPGNPKIVVSSIIRTGGLNYVYNAEPDGLTLTYVASGRSSPSRQPQEEARFDMRKARMVAAYASDIQGLLHYHTLPFTNILDAIEAGPSGPQIVYPGTVAGAEGIEGARMIVPWLCERLRLNCKTPQVSSDGNAEIALMMERGEANLINSAPDTWEVTRPGWVAAGTIKPFVYYSQEGTERPTLPSGVVEPPFVHEVLPSELEDEWKMVSYIETLFGQNMWTGPDVPEPIVQALRQAMTDMMNDSEARGGMERLGLDTELLDPAQAEEQMIETTQTFLDNQADYGIVRQEIWDKYWRN